jgi:Reverse transcriptase (RNA-dependent DNA polymerase)
VSNRVGRRVRLRAHFADYVGLVCERNEPYWTPQDHDYYREMHEMVELPDNFAYAVTSFDPQDNVVDVGWKEVKKQARKEYKPLSSVSWFGPTVNHDEIILDKQNRFAPLSEEDEDGVNEPGQPFDIALVGAADGVVQDTNQLRVMKFKEAMQTDQKGCLVAVEEEYQRMIDNNVFKIIHRKDVPHGRKVISTIWAMKQKVNGVKCARLVAHSFQQVSGQDYDPQGGHYAPVVTLIVFKIVCILVIMMEMFSHIVDVRGAFLTGDLSDCPVFIDVPEGMELKVKEEAAAEARAKGSVPIQLTDIVLMLQKSLYGLVQSSHLFWRKQSKMMMDVLLLDRSTVDYCLYYKWISDKLFLSVLWVNDMIMACSDLSIVEGMKKLLTKTFEIDDVGPMQEFVGCKIEYDRAAAQMSFT